MKQWIWNACSRWHASIMMDNQNRNPNSKERCGAFIFHQYWTCTAMSPENQVMEVPFTSCWPTPYLVWHLPSLFSSTSHLSCRAPPISHIGHLPSLESGTSRSVLCTSFPWCRATHVSCVGHLPSLVWHTSHLSCGTPLISRVGDLLSLVSCTSHLSLPRA